MPHLRPLCAVAFVVNGCWDPHYHSRDEVPGDVVVLPAWELALKHFNQHEVQLHALQTHPGERSQEAKVENTGDDGAHQLRGRHMQTLHVRDKTRDFKREECGFCILFFIYTFILSEKFNDPV